MVLDKVSEGSAKVGFCGSDSGSGKPFGISQWSKMSGNN